jgi:hypothetical protein
MAASWVYELRLKTRKAPQGAFPPLRGCSEFSGRDVNRERARKLAPNQLNLVTSIVVAGIY